MTRSIGYYGVFIVISVAIPVALVWLVADLLFHVSGPTLLVGYILAPMVALGLWRLYLKLAGGWLG
jgi:hypothetical protein